MPFVRSVAVTLAVLGLYALPSPTVAQDPETFKIRLFPLPRSAGMAATIAGKGSASAVLIGSKLTIAGTFEGLRSAATVARLHRGVVTGVRGSAFKELTVSQAASGTIAGTVELTPFELQGLRSGQLYVQIHSEKAPDGNLWGWLLR